MDLYRSLRAVSNAPDGEGQVDWQGVGDAAKGLTSPGSIDLDPGEHAGYARDVRDARDRVGAVTGLSFPMPERVEIQNRHHWIDANVTTFQRVMRPVERRQVPLPEVTRTINTGTMSITLSFLGRNVLGQYDPLLLAEEPNATHGLYFVRPNIRRVAGELDIDYDRFRRWIAFHEVTHAAEFGAAPWLSGHLEERVEEGVDALAGGSLAIEAFRELNVTMTAVEGYAELVMDRAFDTDSADLREKIDRRRQGGGPLTRVMRRLLGLGLKRRQYERGRRFFESIADERGLQAAGAVWDDPWNLPKRQELDRPEMWLARVDP